VQRYEQGTGHSTYASLEPITKIPYNPFEYKRRISFPVDNIGGKQVPVVIADLSRIEEIGPEHLRSVGYDYNPVTDKWNISDGAADYIFTGHQLLPFSLPGTLKVIVYPATWQEAADAKKYFPIYSEKGYLEAEQKSEQLNFVMIDCYNDGQPPADYSVPELLGKDESVVFCLSSTNRNAMQSVRRMLIEFMDRDIQNPVVLMTDSSWYTPDEHLIHFAGETGALLLDGMGDGICLGYSSKAAMDTVKAKGRTYLPVNDIYQFTNNTAFSILQATRTRISKTEYISCPSCGRTLFDLQETTAKIRAVTHHLKGVKIAIMGCIVNGPGEMADADFGYVGSGPGKITLYKGKEVIKKNVSSDIAVNELIELLRENGAWINPSSNE